MRRAQAALEFLTTYGWAFLVILVMIGALAYFGVLNPSNLLPPRCTFSPEISCLEQKISSTTNSLQFRFRNDLGQLATFDFNATEVSSGIGANACYILPDNGTSTAFPCDIGAGRVAAVNCTFPAAVKFSSGVKMKFEVDAIYKKSGGVYNNPLQGEVYGSVQ